MAKQKVINRKINAEGARSNFTNIPSETIFSFGNFRVDTNFSPRVVRDFGNVISSFVKPITLESLNVSEEESIQIKNYTDLIKLNTDYSDLGGYVKFGSLKELLRVSIENILLSYPASLYISHQNASGNVFSVYNYNYDEHFDYATFEIPILAVSNKFGLVIKDGSEQLPQGRELANLNVAYNKYVIWRKTNPTGNTHVVLGFTGSTNINQNLKLKVFGNPFPEFTGSTQGFVEYHVKPAPFEYNKFYGELTGLEKYLLKEKRTDGYVALFKKPSLLENGEVSYSDEEIMWPTSDGYNIEFRGVKYDQFLELIGILGEEYDTFKTDLIKTQLVPQSLLIYDKTEHQKMEKLLRVYGRNFDEIKQYIDAIANVNKLTYNKKYNISDVLVKNFAKTLGWDGVTLVDEDTLLTNFFSVEERKPEDLLPPEVDVELWRRILINSQYLFSSKGTRHAIETMFLMVGVPEPFINVTEYVYTVSDKINPDAVTVSLADLPSASLPYNSDGYPIAPKETKDFYFQMSGTTDAGQAYMDNFRKVGFKLNRTVDNKKSWIRDGFVERKHYTIPNYKQKHSDLVLNTKEVDVSLDIARGIEYDMWNYNVQQNYPITNTGVTTPFIYINIPFTYGVSANTFTINEDPQGDIQVNFNGITLMKGTGAGDKDYYINPGNARQVILNGGVAQTYSNGVKDVIKLTYGKDRLNTGRFDNVEYVVTYISANPDGITIPLPEIPLGEIQLTVNGITLSKGTTLYTGDYIINPSNAQEIIVVNSDLMNYLISNPVVTISYFKSSESESIGKRSEVYRVDSFSSTKFFYNSSISRYTYVLDFEPPDGAAVKIIVNGITLTNGIDFVLNATNRKQVLFNTSSIGLGYIIHAFYVVDANASTTAITFGDYEFPDVSQVTFLEYTGIINERLVNAQTRKTVTDHEGGFYPTVLRLYEEYLKRVNVNDPLVPSNGYTFTNLYPFMSKFNGYFHRFIDSLLSSTIILKKGGVLVRNTAYTKQKFAYKRGVSFNSTLKYLGDDGSEFKIVQDSAFSLIYLYLKSENKPVFTQLKSEGGSVKIYTKGEVDNLTS